MKEKPIWIGRDGFPVEHIEGRPILNWLRDRIHGVRKVCGCHYCMAKGFHNGNR